MKGRKRSDSDSDSDNSNQWSSRGSSSRSKGKRKKTSALKDNHSEGSKGQNNDLKSKLKAIKSEMKAMKSELKALKTERNQLIEKIKDNECVCRICLQNKETIDSNGKQILALCCGHLFCDHCLNEYVDTSDDGLPKHHLACPVCRQIVAGRLHLYF